MSVTLVYGESHLGVQGLKKSSCLSLRFLQVSSAHSPLSVNTGSNVCVAWSSVGKRAGCGHSSELPFLIWRQERSQLACSGGDEGSREDLVFQECTQLFPVEQRLTKAWQAPHVAPLHRIRN